jgi:hypothetical protein
MATLKLNNFKEVAARYDDIKPVISKNHTWEQDIRPLSQRRYKWQRIKKLSDTCYAFLDGYSFGDDVFKWWGAPNATPTSRELQALAPIVWECVVGRNEAGDRINNEILKIRNGTGSGAHSPRYVFLDNFLPKSIGFDVQNGKQFVYAWTDKQVREKFFLPKSNYVGATAWDQSQTLQRRDFDRADDNKQIILMREVGTEHWCNIGSVFTPKKRRSKVDVKAKAELKPYIDDFWDWACAIGVVLPVDDSDYITTHEYALADHGVIEKPWGNSWNARKVITILKTIAVGGSESPAALSLLVRFLSDTHIKQATSPEDLKVLRVKFNQFINQSCGLVDKWEEPVGKVGR